MNNLKNALYTTIILLAIFATVTYTACKPDNCKNITCLNGGSCSDGKCACPDGYTGSICETKLSCEGVVCLNDGVCKSGKCACTGGYWGDSCQYEYRARFYKTYRGDGTNDTGHTYTGYHARFSKDGDDKSSMLLETWEDKSENTLRFKIQLESTGHYELLPGTAVDSLWYYSGSGILSDDKASLVLHANKRV
ncbi:MAG TPA: calcium-binding EGF-like domain-containing protein, partial [Flavipsychrobacter sp.]